MDFGRETFLLRMAGAAMSPLVEDGDWLFVDPDEPAEPGRLVAIEHPETGEATARLMAAADGRRVLGTPHADAREIVLDRDTETMILGTVVFQGRRV